MAIVLYTTDCPKCKVLEKKLDEAGVTFTINRDIDKLIAAGIKEAPVLSIDGVYHNFSQAIQWVNAKKEGRGIE